MGVLRILTDRGTEYCGKAEQHDYELFLAMCCGRTPLATMLAGKEIWNEKVAALN
jgi:hypothetical protein